MQLSIHGSNISVNDPLWTHAERRVGQALGRVSNQIERVVVRFSREGGDARGHVDLDVTLCGGGVLRIEDTSRDPYQAIARAASRARTAIVRRLGRLRARRRQI